MFLNNKYEICAIERWMYLFTVFWQKHVSQIHKHKQAEGSGSSFRKTDIYILRIVNNSGTTFKERIQFTVKETKIKSSTKVFLILKSWRFSQVLR